MSEVLQFIREFVKHSRQTGAVAPSSAALAMAMTGWLDWTRVRRVVEFGPGTGPVTRILLQRLGSEGEYLGIETNPELAQILRLQLPGIRVVVDSAANAERICTEEGWREVDAVISGLPFAVFNREEQTQILGAAFEILRPGGYFSSFAYLQGLPLPAARRFRRLLEGRFAPVETSSICWLNLPPAVVYRCRKPE